MTYRILMIAPTSFFLDYGAHVRILEEARVLQKFGHRVKIVTYPLGRNLSDLDIERTLPIPFKSRHEVGPSRSKLLIDVLLAIKTLQTAIAFKPHIIHGHMHEGALIGSLVSRLLRVPLVFDFQGSMSSEMADHRFISPNGLLFKTVRKVESFIDRLPHHILTSSNNAADVLKNDFQINGKQITVLSDCVNADSFLPVADGIHANSVETLRAHLNIPHGRCIVIYIGLLDEYRGTSVMLDAMKDLLARGTDAHLVVIGFPNIEHYQTYAAKLGISERVNFVGRVPYEDVPLWLSLGDIAIEPKMSATEAAGKVLDYMAVGLPTVAFDIPVMREYLGNWGMYAPLGDARIFADQMQKLLMNPFRAREIGEALRARAIDLFSWERAGHEIERVYASVLL